MYARIQFAPNQKITKQDLEILEKTVADEIDSSDMIEVIETGEIEVFSSWRYAWTWDEKDDPEKKKKLVKKTDIVMLGSNKEYLVDLDLFLSKHSEMKISIRGLPPTVDRDYATIISEIIRVQDKFEEALKRFDKNVEFNEKCDVHISNMGILNINEVGIIENACTDSLQSELDKGWRILAAMPQPDQRRYDYVLGRYNPDREIGKSKAVRL